MSVVYEIENRGKRSHIIGVADHISGGEVKVDSKNTPVNVYFNSGTKIKVTEACGEKLLKGWKDEITLVKKINRKD